LRLIAIRRANRANKMMMEAAGGGGGKDPLIAALIQKLPDTGTDWSADDRVMWLQMIAMAFQMAYGQKEAIKITKEAAH
jgi:hypothetical protein